MLVSFILTKKLANKWLRKWTGRPLMADIWRSVTVKLVQNPDMIEMHLKVGITGHIKLWFTEGPSIPDKACLHVGGIVENASEKLIELKFGVFGSIGEVKFLPDKNIGKFPNHRRLYKVNLHHRWSNYTVIFSFCWTSKSVRWQMYRISTWKFILRVSHFCSSTTAVVRLKKK